MGIYGRDYMRERGRGGLYRPSLSVNTRLILANVLLWFLFAGSLSWGGQNGTVFTFLWDHLLLHPTHVFGRLEIWQPFTAIWFHDPTGFDHIFFNMLFLFLFGRPVESMLGPRRYLQLYLLAGAASTLAYLPYAALAGVTAPALGASGAIYGVGVLLALREPRMPVYLFIIRIPMWFLVGVFMVGRELANLAVLHHDLGATVGHLSGAAVGLVWYRLAPRPALPRQGTGFLARWRQRRKAARLVREVAQDAKVQSRVDELLEKISRDGIQALSPAEKDYLERASRRFGSRR